MAVATAVPPFVLDQSDVARRVEYVFGSQRDIRYLIPIFGNAGISRRYSCVPVEWDTEPHGWKERNDLYLVNAVSLFEEVTLKLLEKAKISRDAIDAIVTVSTTGIATPSLDALLVEKLQLRRDIKRLPIFGLGCAGGVTGLARAADLARSMPGKNVLFLVVELCALTFRKDDFSNSNIVATALFGDGAAGAIL